MFLILFAKQAKSFFVIVMYYQMVMATLGDRSVLG